MQITSSMFLAWPLHASFELKGGERLWAQERLQMFLYHAVYKESCDDSNTHLINNLDLHKHRWRRLLIHYTTHMIFSHWISYKALYRSSKRRFQRAQERLQMFLYHAVYKESCDDSNTHLINNSDLWWHRHSSTYLIPYHVCNYNHSSHWISYTKLSLQILPSDASREREAADEDTSRRYHHHTHTDSKQVYTSTVKRFQREREREYYTRYIHT